MSGFEVAGILLGVIPLVFQGFLEVSRFLEEYRGVERRIWTVLQNIEKEKSIFQMAFKTLLSNRFESEEVDGLLQKLWDLRLKQESDFRLDGIELHSAKVINHALESSKNTLGEVRAILVKLGPLFEKVDKPTLHLMARPPLEISLAQTASKSWSWQKFGQGKTVKVTVKVTLKVTLKGTLKTLKELAQSLSKCNTDIMSVVNCDTNNRLEPRDRYSEPSSTHPISDQVVERAREDATAMRMASEQLYKIVSRSLLCCRCHLAHLRLDQQLTGVLTTRTPKQRPPDETSVTAAAKILFRLTDKSKYGSAQNDSNTVLHLLLTAPRDQPGSTAAGGTPPICGELLADEQYERYFQGGDGDCNNSFFLRRTSSQETPAIDSECISFHELVSSRSNQLLPGDILLIAASLARSILRFSTSPWINDWTPQTIQFFQKYGRLRQYEQPAFTPALWTPHLFLHPTEQGSDPSVDQSWGMNYLGLMLLELGQKRRLELEGLQPLEKRQVIEGALGYVAQNMGVKYANIVRRYLGCYVDFMGERNLRMLLCDIDSLEKQASNFVSGQAQ